MKGGKAEVWRFRWNEDDEGDRDDSATKGFVRLDSEGGSLFNQRPQPNPNLQKRSTPNQSLTCTFLNASTSILCRASSRTRP